VEWNLLTPPVSDPIRAVDCASAGVTDAKNLARILLIRQELSDKFLERGDAKNKNSSPAPRRDASSKAVTPINR